MNVRSLSTLVCIVSLAFVSACSTGPRRDERMVQQDPAYRSQGYAEYGQVRSIGVIPMESRTTGGGAILGAVIGAVIGNQVGSGTGRGVATGLGAVGGALAGNEIEKRRRGDDEVYRISVRLDNGSVREFDYERIDDLRVGDRVKIEGGVLHRQ
mgnify:CR=1 FL=1